MTGPLQHRVCRLEQVEEARRRPIRERIHAIMARLGGTLSDADVEAVVTRHVDTPNRIRRWRDEGRSQDEILDRLVVRG
jgi:hypothetical protein